MTIISVCNVTKKFGDQTVLEGVSFDVEQGERVIVLGQNGAGKTTLFRSLLGEYQLDTGHVSIFGIDPRINRKDALQFTAFIPQLPPPLPFSVASLLKFACSSTGAQVAEVFSYCEEFGLALEEHLNKPFVKLSGGMKQKVLASLAFARHAPVMLFDEPTANLDPDGRKMFGQIIQRADFSDTTMIFISHRIEELDTAINRVLLMDFGRLVKNDHIR